MSKVYISFDPASPFLRDPAIPCLRMPNKETLVQEVSVCARIFPIALFVVSKD